MKLKAKYESMKQDVLFEEIGCEDADYIIAAYGSSARICQKAYDIARAEGLKVGIFRFITLYPFPEEQLIAYAERGVKGILSVEMSLGQLVDDIKLAVGCRTKVEHFGRVGGIIHSPEEVVNALKTKIIGG